MTTTGCDPASEKRILCVGLVCMDIVSRCASYPQEDSDQRCLEQWWQRGGNASNSCTVLSQLGAPCELLATIANSHEVRFLQSDLQSRNIRSAHCRYHDGCSCPISIVVINELNGSRTIIHSNKNLPELSVEDFKAINLHEHSWVHFECRPSGDAIQGMLELIARHNTTQERPVLTSLELEKTREYTIQQLASVVDYIFVSKDLAKFLGAKSKTDAIEVFRKRCHPRATIICAWGDEGAIGRSPDGAVVEASAHHPNALVDTLAAGDTFNAATIVALHKGRGLQEALNFGCRVAGTKCGLQGLDDLGAAVKDILKQI